MKIAVIGDCGPTAAPWATAQDLSKSLESMGHDVIRVFEREWGGELPPAVLDSTSMVLFNHTPGWGPRPHIFERFMADCRSRGIAIAGLHLDLWKGLERASTIASDPAYRVDLFAQADPDLEWWRARGVTAMYLPPGVLEASCYLAEPDPELAIDVTFCGARGYHGEYKFRADLIDWLERTYGPRFKLWEHGKGMREARLNVLYASARVVVGDSCFAGKIPGYWSDRLPETLGRGGRLIFPRIDGLPEDVPCRLFEPGNLADLQAKIEDALVTPEAEAMEERRRAVAWALKGETYRHRLQALLEALAERGLLKAAA